MASAPVAMQPDVSMTARLATYAHALLLLTLGTVACGDDDADAQTDGTTAAAESTTGAPVTTTATTSDDGTGASSDATGVETSAADTTAGESTGGPNEFDPRVADCLRIDACEADGGAPIGLQACLAHALDVPWTWASVGPHRLELAAMACKLAATDCEGVRACTPPVERYAALCEGSIGGDLCDGDTWVWCDELGTPVGAMDCTAAGQSCNQDIWAGCGTDPCEFGVTEAECDGDVLRECAPNGTMQQVDCTSQYNYVNVSGPKSEEVYAIAGETCGFDELKGSLGCIGTGETCDFFEQSCDGDVLTTCAGGKLAERDCAALEPGGQSCGYWQSGPFSGAATCGLVDPACDLGGDESCDGDVLSFCNWDTADTLDCAAAGYGGCATAQAGERTIAYCTP